MEPDEFFTEIESFWSGSEIAERPLAVIDLDAAGIVPADFTLPPCPVIGVGSGNSSLAGTVDAVIELPVTLDSIVRQICARPKAAAAIVQLLRILPSLPAEQGLTAELFAFAMLQGSEEHGDWLDENMRREHPSIAPGEVHVERDGAVLTLIMDRPDAGNAIDRSMRDALYEGYTIAALDSSIEQVRLRARGRIFSLGADLSEFGTTRDPATAHAIRAMTLPARMAVQCASRLEAHINGACVGAGLEMAAFASRVTASSGAWFQLPELAMGILPGAGGCVSLTRRIGRQRAALMILSGKRISVRQALEWGLIDAIVDDPA